MIPFEFGNIKFYLPQNYSEISFEMWLKMKYCNNDNELINLLTGKELILTDENLSILDPFIDFLKSDIENSKIDFFCNNEVIKDLYRGTWRQKVTAQRLLLRYKDNEIDFENSCLELINIYTNVSKNEILKQSVYEVINLFNQFIEQLIKIIENDKKLETKPDPEIELIGGYELLKEVSEFNTMKFISDSFRISFDEAWELLYIKVYKLLRSNAIEIEIQKRKLELIKEQNKP